LAKDQEFRVLVKDPKVMTIIRGKPFKQCGRDVRCGKLIANKSMLALARSDEFRDMVQDPSFTTLAVGRDFGELMKNETFVNVLSSNQFERLVERADIER
jgi:hypothetical protein